MSRDGTRVVTLLCNLPALANPLTDLVGGTLRAPPYNLRESQIAELLELVQDPQEKIEIVFVLDGYDELRCRSPPLSPSPLNHHPYFLPRIAFLGGTFIICCLEIFRESWSRIIILTTLADFCKSEFCFLTTQARLLVEEPVRPRTATAMSCVQLTHALPPYLTV